MHLKYGLVCFVFGVVSLMPASALSQNSASIGCTEIFVEDAEKENWLPRLLFSRRSSSLLRPSDTDLTPNQLTTLTHPTLKNIEISLWVSKNDGKMRGKINLNQRNEKSFYFGELEPTLMRRRGLFRFGERAYVSFRVNGKLYERDSTTERLSPKFEDRELNGRLVIEFINPSAAFPKDEILRVTKVDFDPSFYREPVLIYPHDLGGIMVPIPEMNVLSAQALVDKAREEAPFYNKADSFKFRWKFGGPALAGFESIFSLREELTFFANPR